MAIQKPKQVKPANTRSTCNSTYNGKHKKEDTTEKRKKGYTCTYTTFNKANPVGTEKLQKIGFQFDGKLAANDTRSNGVYNALIRYKELNGDLLIPQPFIMPEDSSDLNKEFWGLRFVLCLHGHTLHTLVLDPSNDIRQNKICQYF